MKSESTASKSLVSKEPIKTIVRGKILREWRLSKGLTIEKLAKESGISRSHISDLELGKITAPSLQMMEELANALGENVVDLINIEESAVYKKVFSSFQKLDFLFLDPLGLKHQDVIHMIRDQGAILAEAFDELLKSHGITRGAIMDSILRAVKIDQKVYGEDLEEEAALFSKRLGLPQWVKKDGVRVREEQCEKIEEFLKNKFNYKIIKTDERIEAINDLTWLFVEGDPPLIVMHPKLSTARRLFLLAREAYFAIKQIKERRSYTREPAYTQSNSGDMSHEIHRTFYEGSYFAGAVLLPKEQFVNGVKAFFERTEWDEEEFLACGMNTTPTTFFVRLGELLSHKMGLGNYNYIRFDKYEDARGYRVTDTLNMTEQIDYSAYLDLELPIHDKHLHHCRRWLSIDMMEDESLCPPIPPIDAIDSDLKEKPVAKARQAVYRYGLSAEGIREEKDIPLFVFSAVSALPVARHYRSVSLAFELDESFKEKVSFWNSAECRVPEENGNDRIEYHACELCSEEACKQRAKLTLGAHIPMSKVDDNRVSSWLKEEWMAKESKRQKVKDYTKVLREEN